MRKIPDRISQPFLATDAAIFAVTSISRPLKRFAATTSHVRAGCHWRTSARFTTTPLSPFATTFSFAVRTACGAAGITSADIRFSYAIAIAVLIFAFMAVCSTGLLYVLRLREVEA